MSHDTCPIWLGIALAAAGTILGYGIALVSAGVHP
jgi:hypothetical protein